MDLFLANKQLNFDVSLKEIQTMTPEQAYLLEKQIKKAAKELERINLNNGRNLRIISQHSIKV